MTVKRTVEANRSFCMVEKPQMRKLSVQVTRNLTDKMKQNFGSQFREGNVLCSSR